MNLMQLGGPMMWPLLGLSVAALGIILERALVFSTFRLPDKELEERLCKNAEAGEFGGILRSLHEKSPNMVSMIRPLLAGTSQHSSEQTEQLAAIEGKDILARLDKRLCVLSTTARVAPLMGLLGTVLGMIQTFSRMSEAQGAVDMTALAGGIWQALLTTATGLSIAIPVLLAHQYFSRRRDNAAFRLQRLANLIMAHMQRKDAEQ